MRRVLVTGATGCLGHALVDALLAAGCEVTANGRNAALGEGLRLRGARFVALDLAGAAPLAPLLEGADTVFHCAALSSAWGRAEDFERANVTATARLLAAARQAGAGRFVFASTPSLYADGAHRLNVAEDAPLPARFATHYARTKHAAERLVLAADRPGALRCVALRPRAIYGPHDRALMPRLLAAARRGPVPLIGGGESLIDITHVTDAARAMILAARHAGDVGGRVFNVTSGEAYRFRDLLARIGAALDLPIRTRPAPYGVALALAAVLERWQRLTAPEVEPVLTRQAVISLGRSLTLDITAARRDLGYAPRVGLDEGILDYAGGANG